MLWDVMDVGEFVTVRYGIRTTTKDKKATCSTWVLILARYQVLPAETELYTDLTVPVCCTVCTAGTTPREGHTLTARTGTGTQGCEAYSTGSQHRAWLQHGPSKRSRVAPVNGPAIDKSEI